MNKETAVRLPTATESVEQQCLMRWAQAMSAAHPELKLLFHIPNEGKRSAQTGQRMQREGLRAGVPDLCLPVARGGMHGLFVELKRKKGGRVSEAQRQWIEALRGQGYRAEVCMGWEAAADVILCYIREK